MNYQELLQKLAQDLPTTKSWEQIETYKMVIPDWWVTGLFLLAIIIALVTLLMWVLPMYSVWAGKKSGQAELSKANFAEQVAIAEANARLKSAELNRKAEEIDALAVSNSVIIIGESLKANDGYLRWQWIKMMCETDNEVIYVPTEANLPILEAGRNLKSPLES